MAEGESGSGPGGRPGKRRPPEKTFGDARLGIPSGGRSEERPRRQQGADSQTQAPGAASAEPVPEKKGPIVEHRGGRVARPPKPAPEKQEPAPERVFHRQARPAEMNPEPPPAPEAQPPLESESFAEMFARSSSQTQGRLAPGQEVDWPRAANRERHHFSSSPTSGSAGGHKTEALIDTRELRDEHGELKRAVGDEITGYLKSLEDGIWLTTALPKGAPARGASSGARSRNAGRGHRHRHQQGRPRGRPRLGHPGLRSLLAGLSPLHARLHEPGWAAASVPRHPGQGPRRRPVAARAPRARGQGKGRGTARHSRSRHPAGRDGHLAPGVRGLR